MFVPPRFFSAHGDGEWVFRPESKRWAREKGYKEEHIWSSKIDSFNNSIHHNTPHTTHNTQHTTLSPDFCLNTKPNHIANMLFAALLAVLPALAQAGNTISGHATV
jgi:hypothetical protein